MRGSYATPRSWGSTGCCLATASPHPVGLDAAEVTGYGGHILRARVSSTRRDRSGFVVDTDGGREFTARRPPVTTGLVDELPDVADLRARWGRDVLHRPFCHGWEIRDQPIGVLGTSEFAIQPALLRRQWSRK